MSRKWKEERGEKGISGGREERAWVGRGGEGGCTKEENVYIYFSVDTHICVSEFLRKSSQ